MGKSPTWSVIYIPLLGYLPVATVRHEDLSHDLVLIILITCLMT